MSDVAAPPASITDSQCDHILKALLAGESITPLEALERFGCLRLGGRIFDLRQRGHVIDTEWEKDGHGKRWARYRIAAGSQLVMTP
jgi:hypothetical protein